MLNKLSPLSGPVDASGEPESGELPIAPKGIWACLDCGYIHDCEREAAAAAVPSSPAQAGPVGCINCGKRFALDGIRGWFGEHIGPFCELCYEETKKHSAVPVADFKQMLRDEIACQQDYATSTEPHAGLATPREHRHTASVLRTMLMLIEFKESLALPPSSPIADSPTWQPIETAPKDGTNVLVGSVYRTPKLAIDVARWRKEFNEWYTNDLRPFPAATHWMPLPSAPSPSAGAAKE